MPRNPASLPPTRRALLRTVVAGVAGCAVPGLAAGWTLQDFGQLLEFDPARQEQALCGDEVDAVFFVAGHPNGLTQGATTGCRARLVRVAGAPPGDRGGA